MVLLKIVAIALGAISAQTLILYIADKIKAKMGAWRIKEKTLLLFSFFGGGLGGLLGTIASSVLPFNANVLAKPRIIPGLFGYISNASRYVFSAIS